MDWYSVRCKLVQTIIPRIVIVPYPTVDEVGRCTIHVRVVFLIDHVVTVWSHDVN